MNRQEVIEKSKELLNHSIEGFEVESPKIDFKRKWYDLAEKKGINEFVKDTSAIANTIGLDGFIIIGYDDKTHQFHNSKFTDSNILDSARIPDIVIKKCSEGFVINTYDFKFEENELSVIHIPTVLYKPIVILDYQKYNDDGSLKKSEQQRIFVRKNSRNDYATKNDLELMYYDRKNIQADFDYFIDFLDCKTNSFTTLENGRDTKLYNSIEIHFLIENLGRRKLPIKSSEVYVKTKEREFHLIASRVINERGTREGFKSLICNIKQNENQVLKLLFSQDNAEYSIEKQEIQMLNVIFELSNGNKITKRNQSEMEQNT